MAFEQPGFLPFPVDRDERAVPAWVDFPDTEAALLLKSRARTESERAAESAAASSVRFQAVRSYDSSGVRRDAERASPKSQERSARNARVEAE